MENVLNTSFFLPFGKRGVTRSAAEAALIQDLICYGSVWILTDQMQAVPRLLEIMGLDAFERAITEGALRFVHDRHILAWPVVKGYTGIVPFEALASTSSGDDRDFTQISTRDLAFRLLIRSHGELRRVRHLSRLIEESTAEFGELTDVTPTASREQSQVRLLSTLALYEQVIASMPGFPLRESDITALRMNLQRPKGARLTHGRGRSTVTYRVMTLQTASGPASVVPEEVLQEKQLALLDLVLSDRFLAAQAVMQVPTCLHTELSVEQVLTARVAAVRKAAAGELDVVLRGERVELPVLSKAGPFPYEELLQERLSRPARAFQSVVGRRDSNPTSELLQEYLAAIRSRVGDRFAVKVARFLFANVVGIIEPASGLLAGLADSFVVDRLLSRFDASVFVDDSLRRMAGGANSASSGG